MTSATLIAPPHRLTPTSEPNARRTYACPGCGHILQVSGLGRHRVHFALDDERSDDPMMNRVCPACGHCLPGKEPAVIS
jgi:hypothetical protein